MTLMPRPAALAGTLAVAVFVGALLVLFGGSVWTGWSYWLAAGAPESRELHDLVSPGGSLGVAWGLLGTVLMLAMLLYSVRKAMPRAPLGPMSLWLRFHIACGLFGPAFIVLHSGMRWPTGLIAVAFWCMVLVALSGAFGRWVYGLLPRAAGGRTLALDEAREQLSDLRAELVRDTADLDAEALGEAVALVRDVEGDARSVSDLVRLLRDSYRLKRRVRALLDRSGLPEPPRRSVEKRLLASLRIRRGLDAVRVSGRLLRYWHLFHRPLAGAMYVIVAVHVAGAVLLGGSLSRLSELGG